MDPVDPFENAKPSSDISISTPDQVLDMQVKQLSLLQHQTGHLETELEKVESNAKYI